MPGIPDRVLDEIRGRADIVQVIEAYVPLKRRGADYWGCCPFHHEKTPSFKVSAHSQAYYCFGCKKHGSVFQFIMDRENVDFVGSVRLLAQRYGVQIPEEGEGDGPGRAAVRAHKDRLFDLLKAVAVWYQQVLRDAPEADNARLYVKDRGIPPEIVKQFGLGFAPDNWEATLRWGSRLGYEPALLNAAGLVIPREGQDGFYDRFRGRLMFPICDEMGRVVGFSGRVLEKDAKTAKYVNSPETEVFKKSRLLYALHHARTSFKDIGFALVCEGQLDVIACHRAGMTNAVAPQGTAFTENHAALLRRFTDEVVFCFDADEAGRKATRTGIELAITAGLRAKVVELPGEAGKEDPDSLFKKHGAEYLKGVLSGGVDAVEHVIRLGLRTYDAATPDGKGRIVDEVLPVINRHQNPVLRAGYCQDLARQLGLPEAAVMSALQDLQNRLRRQETGRFAAQNLRHPANAQEAGPAAANAPAEPASPSAAAAKPAAGMNLFVRLELMLLDIALRHETSARQLAARLAHERISTTPVGQALNMVLGLAAEGEWEAAGRHLAADPVLGADADVGRILVSADFAPPPDPSSEDVVKEYAQRVEKAREDCLLRFESELLRIELARLQAELAAEKDPARAAELGRRFQELTVRRHSLKKRPPPAG